MSNHNIILSLEADSDLQDIFIYTYTTWGIESAENYLNKIDKSLSLLLNHPEAGKPKESLFHGCRCLIPRFIFNTTFNQISFEDKI